jgi:hypothetical protein
VPAFSHAKSRKAAPSIITTASTTSSPESQYDNAKNFEGQLSAYNVNMTHIELCNNLYTKEFLFREDSGHPDNIPPTIYMKYALMTPYLMHQVLAASALHLSTTSKEFCKQYREHSTGLQNRALALLNECNPAMEVTPDNCVQLFLFSSLVGVHLLCDTLRYQRGSLEEFTSGFTHCLSVCRGVLAVVNRCGELLLETELGPHLLSSRADRESTHTKGSECDDLRDLVNAATVNPSLRKVYQESVVHLQQVFDAHCAGSGSGIRVPKVVAWLILISPEYVDALRHREAEALIILAHFAVLLHRGRDMWLMGDGGRFLIESICGSLGADWQEWLKLPKAALQEDLIA